MQKETAAGREFPANSGAPLGKGSHWLLAALIVVILLLTANHALLSGKISPQWDAVDFFGPSFALVGDSIRAHHLVVWNPWTSAGTPDFAEPELGSASPILIATSGAIKHPRTAFVTYWMIIWIGGGLGMLGLTRHLRCPWWGGLIASLGFVTSGFFLNHAQHMSSLYSIAFLPWICWRLDDALLTKRYWSAAQAGVLYGLSALGGYPQFTILTSGFLPLWTIGRLLFPEPKIASLDASRSGKSRFVAAVVKLSLVGIVGGLIFCPAYLGFMTETHGYSDRVGQRSRVEVTTSNLLPAGAISTLGSPYIALLSYPGLPNRFWPESDVAMSSIYCGSVVLVLAIIAMLHRSAWRWWLAFLVVLFLCCSVGNQLPLRGWVYDLVPPTRYFRNASMFSAYSIFLLDVLAALATRDLFGAGAIKSRKRLSFLAVGTTAALASIAVFAGLTASFGSPPFDFHLAIFQLVLTWGVIVLTGFLLVAEVVTWGRAFQVLTVLCVVDAALTIAVSEPVLYSPSTNEPWQIMAHRHVKSIDLTTSGLQRYFAIPPSIETQEVPSNDNLLFKIPILDSYIVFRNRFEVAFDADPSLIPFALGDNRIWFSPNAAELPPNDRLFSAFTTQLRNSHSPVLLVHTTEEMLKESANSKGQGDMTEQQQGSIMTSLAQLAPASAIPVQLVSYTPTYLAFTVTTPSAGWLMVTDRWARGWKAEVNGQPATVYGADFLFRAVRVDPGSNTIRFSYEPKTWLPSLIVSWGTLLMFLVATLARALRDRSKSSTVCRRAEAFRTGSLMPTTRQSSHLP